MKLNNCFAFIFRLKLAGTTLKISVIWKLEINKLVNN